MDPAIAEDLAFIRKACNKLRKAMTQASDRQDYGKAQEYKKSLDLLESLGRKLEAASTPDERARVQSKIAEVRSGG